MDDDKKRMCFRWFITNLATAGWQHLSMFKPVAIYSLKKTARTNQNSCYLSVHSSGVARK